MLRAHPGFWSATCRNRPQRSRWLISRDVDAHAASKAFAPIARGVNTYAGKVTHKAVAQAVNLEFAPFEV